jgi:hypothetical protein
MNGLMRRVLPLVVAIGICALAPGCGYALAGRGNTLPAHIKTIGVTRCVNQSSVTGIDEAFTKALLEEFQGRGKFLIKPDATGVDAVLSCVITSVVLTPSEFTTGTRQASRYTLAVIANVDFKDKTDSDKVLWANPSASARDEYPVTAGTDSSDPSSFLRQNQNAQDRIARQFARTVVTSILESF